MKGLARFEGYEHLFTVTECDLVLKELFVAEPYRRLRVGDALMAQVLADARARNCPRFKWDVLPGNTPAKAFYRRWGGRPEAAWEAWKMATD